MRVIYDLLAYSFSPHGGIARLTDETLKAFGEKDAFEGLLYAPFPLQRAAPRAARLKGVGFPPLPRALGALAPLYHRAEGLRLRLAGADFFHPTFYPLHAHLDHLPLVLTVHDLIHEKIKRADDMPDHNEFLDRKRRYIRKARRIICISQATRDDLLDYYEVKPDTVRVAPLAGDPYFHVMTPEVSRAMVQEIMEDAEHPFILYVGSRQRYKNFEGMLEAFAAWEGRPDHRLVVVGGGAARADHEALSRLGIRPGEIHFAGHLQDDELCALYNRAQAFVYPSFAEGFGIPLLEAMAAGCPLCVSDIPPFREVAGDLAVYFNPEEPGSIREALTQAVAMRATRSYIPAFREHAQSFTWRRFTDTVWEVYEEMLDDG